MEMEMDHAVTCLHFYVKDKEGRKDVVSCEGDHREGRKEGVRLYVRGKDQGWRVLGILLFRRGCTWDRKSAIDPQLNELRTRGWGLEWDGIVVV